MSAIFSDELEVRAIDSNLAISRLDVSSSSYGLDLNSAGEKQILTGISAVPEEVVANLESSLLRDSDSLAESFSGQVLFSGANSNINRQVTAIADNLTGLESGEDSSVHLSSVSTSTDSVYGSLDFFDEFNPTRLDAFKDDYVIAPSSNQTISIDLESSSFDAYLQLIDASNGSLLAFDDDSGIGTNSQLSFTAQAGVQYLIRATSFFSFETGGYSLTTHISTDNPPVPPSPPNQFDSAYGYGIVDAAAAVAGAIGQSRFANVADIGGDQWTNDMIYAPEVWAQGYTGQGITVAVIDSGVDIFHEDLRNNIWVNTDDTIGDGIDNDGNGYIDDQYGWNFAQGQYNYDVRPGTDDPDQGHGTHVAGTIVAANNGFGMTGVAHGANIMALRLGDTADGGSFVNSGDLAEAIYYAVNNGADVINMSLSSSNQRVIDALDYAASQNVIAIMSSGNENQPTPNTPASYATDYGISVGAVDITGNITDFSNRAGTDSRMQHVMAPGEGILSTLPNDDYGYQQGTSMAAPHVAGVVALMLSANPHLTHAQVREILTGTASLGSTSANSLTALTQPLEQGIALSEPLATLNYENSSTQPQALLNKSFERFRVVIPQFELASSRAGFVVDQVADAEVNLEALQGAIASRSQVLEFSYTDDWQFQLQPPLVDKLLAAAIA